MSLYGMELQLIFTKVIKGMSNAYLKVPIKEKTSKQQWSSLKELKIWR